MIKVLISVFAMLVVSSHCLFAQEYSVSGNVKDSAGMGLPDLIVTLLQGSDSSSAGFVMTGDKGAFSFKNVSAGSYIVAISSIGYVPFTYPVSVHDNINALNIVLTRNIRQLAEVTVTDTKPYIETGMGKTMINIDPSIVSAGSNVLELLRKAPGVQVQGSDITLQGVGVMVLVDDKQTYLSGQELADYLAGLSADGVAQIELISQPSSKYDAEGSGGIINVKTRSVNKKGFNGNVSLAAVQNVYTNTHNALNLTYQRNKLTLYANAAQLYATGSLARTVDQSVRDTSTGEHLNSSGTRSIQTETFADYSLRIGGDYKLSEKATGGASVKGIYHPNDEHDETYTDITDNVGVQTRNETSSNLGFLRNHYICNAYLKFSPGTSSSLTFDGDYLYRAQNRYLDLASNNYDGQQQPAGNDLYLKNSSTSLIQASVLRCDYEATLPKDLKVEAGLKSSFSRTVNGVEFEQLANARWIKDSLRTNTFLYKENINAAYISGSRSFGKSWKTQAGLRIENTNATGRQTATGEDFRRTSTALFPTAFVSYTASEKHTVELNCGRRISRPAYTQLNPFLFFISQFSYFQGNPNLLPSYEWFTTLRHSYNHKIFTTVRYGHTSGIVTPAVRFDSSSNAVIASLANFASRTSASLSVDGSKQFWSWWRCSASAGLNYNAYNEINRNKAIASATGFYFSIENELKINKGWTLDTFYHYAQGDLQNLLDHYGARHWMGFNIAKKMWKDSATIRLSVDDPFNLNVVSSRLDYKGVARYSTNKWNTQQVALGFTYKFGSTDNDAHRQRETEEAGRM